MLWEPREFGECREKSTFGHGCDTCNEDPFDYCVPKRRFVNDLISAFSSFRVYNVNGEFAKRHGFTRKQDDVLWTFPDAFYAQEGPPKTANPLNSGLFGLVIFLEDLFTPVQSKRCVASRDFRYISLYGVAIICAKIHVQLIHQCHPVVKDCLIFPIFFALLRWSKNPNFTVMPRSSSWHSLVLSHNRANSTLYWCMRLTLLNVKFHLSKQHTA